MGDTKQDFSELADRMAAPPHEKSSSDISECMAELFQRDGLSLPEPDDLGAYKLP
jgi:hypothetical protein